MAKGKSKITQASEKAEDDLRKNPINMFRCGHTGCKGVGDMDLPAFKIHLADVHKISADQLTGKKQMVMHIDGDRWFSSTYKWTLDSGFEFHQFVEMARAKDDMMRF